MNRWTACRPSPSSFRVASLSAFPYIAGNVRKAREHLKELGIYGPASVERFDGERLPYADNLVNLVVMENLGRLTVSEAMRVLAPGGVLYAKQDGRWRKTVKSRPGDIDEWTHFLHDASGNAVAHDQVVGPPGRLQWSLRRPLESIKHCRPVRKDNLIHTIPSFASKQYMIFTQCYSIQYIFTTSPFICWP